tara:strand:- start:1474 stop:1818 length:345 start_codon:yes stop_codon:yes gene_type:complete
MKNWKGTTGEWILKGFTVWKGGERIRQISGTEGACMTSMRLNHERKIADAELIADAGNTIQKCDLLPSELLERCNEAVHLIKGMKLSMQANPSFNPEGGEFFDFVESAEDLIKG